MAVAPPPSANSLPIEFYSEDTGRDRKRLWVRTLVVIVVTSSLCSVAGFLMALNPTAIAVVSLLLLGFLFYFVKKRRHRDTEDVDAGIELQLQGSAMAQRAQKFKFRDLRRATSDFATVNRLGRGGFGTVYKGVLKNKEVAIKRVSKHSRQGQQEFIAEITTIGSLHHRNLVQLLGWCYEKKELLLVYEYMPNGSLDKLLFGELGLIWGRRYSIIRGVAEALNYLHNGCEKTVLHRDVKSSNIMLDSNFEAKLGDFGLARAIHRMEQTHHSTNHIAGTLGYMAPETFLTSRATMETDVYAFGVVVLEIVCGRKPRSSYKDGGYDGSIAQWVWELHGRGKTIEAVDARMEEGQFAKEEVERMLILGLACCHPNPLERPAMRNVLQVLNGEANPPCLPNEIPLFVWPPMPLSSKEDGENSLRESQLSSFTTLTGR